MTFKEFAVVYLYSLFAGILVVIILMSGCAARTSKTSQTETFDEFVHRTEGVSCAELTASSEWMDPPSCEKVYHAMNAGRMEVSKRFPVSAHGVTADIPFVYVRLYRPKRQWHLSPYPLVHSEIDGRWLRGEFFHRGVPRIIYAEEGVLKHEAIHFYMSMVLPGVERDPSLITDPSEHFVWQVQCHGTDDDLFMDLNGCFDDF